jgi:predicted esterase
LACALLVVFVCIGCPNGSFEVEVTSDIIYGLGNVSEGGLDPQYTKKDLLLDAYVPIGRKAGNGGAVILIHGGSFQEGDKTKDDLVEIAQHLAENGYTCFSINYRLTDDHPPAPASWDPINLTRTIHAAFVDTKAAVRWVRANAATYGIDPNRVAVLGESAGAFCALTAAVPNSGAFDNDGVAFPIPQENNPGINDKADACIDLWGSADHILTRFDPNDPPIMILHGTDDDNFGTPFGAAERIHNLCELFNIPHEFYPIDGEGHGAWDARVNRTNLKNLCLEFLDEFMP